MGYRFKIALLALGVLFGYGSAIAHAGHSHNDRVHCHGGWFGDAGESDHGAPSKKVQ